MRFARTKNTKRNIIFGWLNKIVSTLMPFVIRTVFVSTLGFEFLGIKSIFASILSVLGLAELGIGSAIVFFMYKPIAQDDTDEICALLRLYKWIYFGIGVVILIVAMCIGPFLGYIVKGEYPETICLEWVFILYVFEMVLSYLFFAYRITLFTAFQRQDVISKVDLFVNFFVGVFQIIALIIIPDFYVYTILHLMGVLIENLVLYVMSRKEYPDIKPKGKVNKILLANIKKQVRGVFVGKLCGASRNAFDSIFISLFVNLQMVGVYNNYYFIMVSVSSVFVIVLTSIQAVIGNTVVTKDVNANLMDMEVVNFIYMFLSGWATICMLFMYQPFMIVWMGSDKLLDDFAVVALVIYFYTSKMGDIRYVYSQAAGLFFENRIRSIMEAIGNITLNYILGKNYGIIGIIIATNISMFLFGNVGGAYVCFKHYFKTGLYKYMLNQLKYFGVTVVTCMVVYVSVSRCDGNVYTLLFIRLMCCLLIPPIFMCLLYHKTDIYRKATIWIKEHLAVI